MVLNRKIDRAEQWRAVAFERDHRPEERRLQHEGFRAVNRVDNPPVRARFFGLAELFAQDREIRETFFERFAYEDFDFPVGPGDGAVIWLQFDFESRVVIAADNRAGFDAQLAQDRKE